MNFISCSDLNTMPFSSVKGRGKMSDVEGKEKEVPDKESTKGDDKDRPVRTYRLSLVMRKPAFCIC